MYVWFCVSSCMFAKFEMYKVISCLVDKVVEHCTELHLSLPWGIVRVTLLINWDII